MYSLCTYFWCLLYPCFTGFLTPCLSCSSQKHVAGPLVAAFLLCLQVKAFKERLHLAQRFLFFSGSSQVSVSDLRPVSVALLRRYIWGSHGVEFLRRALPVGIPCASSGPVFLNLAGSRSGALGGVLSEGRPEGPCLLIFLPVPVSCSTTIWKMVADASTLTVSGYPVLCGPCVVMMFHPLFVFIGFMEKLRGGREREIVIHLFATETSAGFLSYPPCPELDPNIWVSVSCCKWSSRFWFAHDERESLMFLSPPASPFLWDIGIRMLTH